MKGLGKRMTKNICKHENIIRVGEAIYCMDCKEILHLIKNN